MNPCQAIVNPKPPAKKLSSFSLGGRFITSSSVGSIPKANAGSESVIKLTHNKCIGSNGVPIFPGKNSDNKDAPKIVMTSPILLDNKNWTSFLILS